MSRTSLSYLSVLQTLPCSEKIILPFASHTKTWRLKKGSSSPRASLRKLASFPSSESNSRLKRKTSGNSVDDELGVAELEYRLVKEEMALLTLQEKHWESAQLKSTDVQSDRSPLDPCGSLRSVRPHHCRGGSQAEAGAHLRGGQAQQSRGGEGHGRPAHRQVAKGV
ncbi:hypothetical protein CEXT_738301 [Caerostris extrusa]|uniref:Uncharacterized protein n=1 Tax=Caerostris extrusa TaxID=172846 RepID=A0AAV4VRK8_CAEEX|nr:hypothetical protein CEXT_738301 [Caerostris extrusa]